MKLYSIDTGYFKLDGGAMFGVVPKSIWNKLNPSDENNLCSWALRCLLIEDEGRLILVDNGIGDKQDAKFFGHYYLHGEDTLDSSLKKHGFHRDDITDVILTHLHFDHCGGSVMREGDQLVPAFKNAVYWSNERHWKWATEPNDRERASFLKENILPIKASGQLSMVPLPDWNTVEFSKNIDLRFVHGHTDAMMIPQIKYKDRIIVFTADLIPSAAHIPLPYLMAYDMFPLTTLKEKKIFLHDAIEDKYILFFEHDRIYECCDLVQTDKGVRAGNYFKVDEI
ncbi:MAG: MBL fold metallo-hydrolase [Chitinophagaceae bacterium]